MSRTEIEAKIQVIMRLSEKAGEMAGRLESYGLDLDDPKLNTLNGELDTALGKAYRMVEARSDVSEEGQTRVRSGIHGLSELAWERGHIYGLGDGNTVDDLVIEETYQQEEPLWREIFKWIPSEP